MTLHGARLVLNTEALNQNEHARKCTLQTDFSSPIKHERLWERNTEKNANQNSLLPGFTLWSVTI